MGERSINGNFNVLKDYKQVNILNPYRYGNTAAWDLTRLVFNQDFDISTQAVTGYGVTFSPDGLNFYITDTTVDDVLEYALSTAWDISTATYTTNKALANDSFATCWANNGTKMYYANRFLNRVYEYTCSTAYDISTAGAAINSFVFTGVTLIYDVFVKEDGTKLYISSDGLNRFY